MIGDDLHLEAGRWEGEVLVCTSCGHDEMQTSRFAGNKVVVRCGRCRAKVATSPYTHSCGVCGATFPDNGEAWIGHVRECVLATNNGSEG